MNQEAPKSMTPGIAAAGSDGRTTAAAQALAVALLTGGGDKPYALGMARALTGRGIAVDFIGSNDLDVPELRRLPALKFLNLRGDQNPGAGLLQKTWRVLAYYARLMSYALTARPRIFHILWNNRFEFFDRTLLMAYYKLLGRRIVFTAHNVNAGKRDRNDNALNRFSLRTQYRLADHIFVHTTKMKAQLADEFAVPADKISVVQLGINNTVPTTELTNAGARRHLGIQPGEKVLLFFGRISPYKGVDCLVDALAELSKADSTYRLVIVGSLQDCADYWSRVQTQIDNQKLRDRIIQRIEFVPDDQTELFFKAADVLILPYTEVFQSGVLILSFSFGLPVIAADVGSFREDVIEGRTGHIFKPKDSRDLARAIAQYFSSPLFQQLEARRQDIRDYANERYSWGAVSETTRKVYETLS
jgi:glycosyltransferase involved in cell wall biosynthesis